jgi:uncharacterized protein YciW
MSPFDTTTSIASGVTETGPIAEAIRTRSNIFEMTQAAEDAVLRPKEFGAFPHDFRAALAARIAAHAGDANLAAQYANCTSGMADLSDPSHNSAEDHKILIAFVDKTSNATNDISADDISLLQSSGVSDADIVRLCELVAFVAYQVRVAAGLRLLQGNKA